MRESARALWVALPVAVVSIAAVLTLTAARRESPARLQDAMVARGRYLVITHACGECHGGDNDPSAKGWLAGSTGPATEFKVGAPPCGIDPKATGGFTTRPRNLTPDNETGLGRFTERQIFNALRYGLRPEDTPDVAITSTTLGKGNFPARPHYLAPPMPWFAWRHMPDADLHAITAYLKRGLAPVVNRVPDGEGPPDFWASVMTPEVIGVSPAPPFPTANEVEPAQTDRERVLRGRQLVIDRGCADCHQGPSPSSGGWLAGVTNPMQEFVFGGCFADLREPCFHGRAKNLTPDETTGIGRFTDRQIFNALRYGLRPEDRPDVQITGTTPGIGNFPAQPHYLGPFMPWTALRHLTDDDTWAIIGYLRHLKPVHNTVAVSDDTPDHWASIVTTLTGYPMPRFPTVNEAGGK